MKLVIQPPFTDLWKKANVYLINNKGRFYYIVSIVKKDGSKTTMTYARYLKTVDKAKFIDKKSRVVHKDFNILNNELSNLLLTNNFSDMRHGTLYRQKTNCKCDKCKLVMYYATKKIYMSVL